MAQLKHPNIVEIHAAGEWQGGRYIVLECVPGGNLAERLRGAQQPEGWAAEIARTIAVAVEHAHKCGIIHRDLKPSNILIASDGSLKVADFGLAKLLREEAGDITITSGINGTPSYMAPEQTLGVVSPQVDVYATGCDSV